jgi:hypothetical protein
MRCVREAVILLVGSSVVWAAAPPVGTAVEILPPRNFPGWQSQNVCYPFVYQESGGAYRMYYTGSASEQWNESSWDLWASGYVTSTDTTTWKYPDNYEQVLFPRRFMEADLVDLTVISGAFDSVQAEAPWIIKDGSVCRMWYSGWNSDLSSRGGGLGEKINFRIGYATSNDGIHWTKQPGSAGAGAVLGLGSGQAADCQGASCPAVIKIGNVWRMYYEGYDGTTRRILSATSSDGMAWTKERVVVDKGGANDKDELGAAVPMIIRRNNRYELWYQGQGRSAPNFHILRAVSDDGLTFTKLDEMLLHPSSALSGSERIHVRSAIVQSDGKVQVFFAKQKTTQRTATYWLHDLDDGNKHVETVTQNRGYSIYTEVLAPVP